jgi:hypothetical protein
LWRHGEFELTSCQIQASAIHATRLYIPIAKARGFEAAFPGK